MDAKLTIGRRLTIGFATVLMLAVLTGATGYWSIRSISNNAITQFYRLMRTDAALAKYAAQAGAGIVNLRRFEKDIFLTIDSKDSMAKYHGKWQKAAKNLSEKLDAIAKAATRDNDLKNLQRMRQALGNYQAGFAGVFDKIRSGEIKTPEAGHVASLQYKSAVDDLERTAMSFSDESGRQMAGLATSLKEQAARTQFLALLFMILCVVIGTGICLYITLGTTRFLKEAVHGLSDSAEQAATASSQIASTSQQLAEGASEQAASIEETSSSLEEMSSMTKQNADHSHQASLLMGETAGIVAEANGSMSHLTQSMAEISSASEQTSKIIKTIDEIAFQTNLLALNAAVEAARAGEAGAGFAVVADEVRNLAMRAAEAAQNTAHLIEGTVKKVKDGSEIVSKTGTQFTRVSESASKMSELIGEISAASAEQAQGIEEINRAVSQMDKVVQQNAANAEESASSAEEMNSQARRVRHFVSELAAFAGLKTHGGERNRTESKGLAKKQPKEAAGNGSKPLVRPVAGGENLRSANGKMSGRNGKGEVEPSQVLPLDDSEMAQF
jgi:methyl-accepting chemotaxis protein